MVFSLALGTTSAVADDAPNGAVASPNVYKIIAENPHWRVLEGTWQPGEEDNFHSHPGDRVSLFTMDCKLRLTKPDGTFKDVSPKAGKAKVRTGKPYQHCWVIRFAHRDVVESYKHHPDHVAYADTHFRPVAGDRISIDYEDAD